MEKYDAADAVVNAVVCTEEDLAVQATILLSVLHSYLIQTLSHAACWSVNTQVVKEFHEYVQTNKKRSIIYILVYSTALVKSRILLLIPFLSEQLMGLYEYI